MSRVHTSAKLHLKWNYFRAVFPNVDCFLSEFKQPVSHHENPVSYTAMIESKFSILMLQDLLHKCKTLTSFASVQKREILCLLFSDVLFNQRWRPSLWGSQASAHQNVAVSGSIDVLGRRPQRKNCAETYTGPCPGAPALFPAHCTAERVWTPHKWLIHQQDSFYYGILCRNTLLSFSLWSDVLINWLISKIIDKLIVICSPDCLEVRLEMKMKRSSEWEPFGSSSH